MTSTGIADSRALQFGRSPAPHRREGRGRRQLRRVEQDDARLHSVDAPHPGPASVRADEIPEAGLGHEAIGVSEHLVEPARATAITKPNPALG